MNRILSVSELGSTNLRKKSTKIKKITFEVKDLVKDLIATLEDNGGVGIAAPQVNRSIKLFIIASKPSDRYPTAPTMGPLPILNPKIIDHSQEVVKDWEGCLSVPGIRAMVPRYSKIEVEFTTLAGKLVKKVFKGFIARIFQHEYDHLDGLVFTDRVESNIDIYSEKEYRKQILNKS